MARLPTVGGDDGNWGTVLNDYLSQEHNSDGSNKNSFRVLNVKDFGAKGDGTTDDSAAVTAALAAAYSANGGTIYFPQGRYRINSLSTLQNDGQATPHQPGIRITGAAPGITYPYSPTSGTILDLRASSGVAKIDTRGRGFLKIDHVTLTDSTGSSVPFIQTTNTTLHIENVQFEGLESAGTNGINSVIDAIILGGTTGTSDGSATAIFQGYGTIIRDCNFRNIRRVAYIRAGCNSILFEGNAISNSCGSNLTNGAAIEIDGTGSDARGNVIIGNVIQMDNYVYGVKITKGQNNIIAYNSFWDPGSNVLGYLLCDLYTDGNTLVDGYNNPCANVGFSYFSEVSGVSGKNSRMTGAYGETSTLASGLNVKGISQFGDGGTVTNTILGIFKTGVPDTLNDLNGIYTRISANTAFASRNAIGANINARYTANSGIAVSVEGLLATAANNGNGTVTNVHGLQSNFQNSSGGTISNGYAGRFAAINSGAGTVTQAVGIRIDSASNSGGGTVGTNYGLLVKDQSGVGTTNYNLYSEGANSANYFQGTVVIGGGTVIKKHLSGTTTWDPANIVNGGITSTTVTVTGAAIGDTVSVGFSVAVPAGALLVGAVTATNTVTVTLFNQTGSSLDLASGTLRADVWQH